MHTVAEIGFWREPKVLAFAARVRNPDAGAWILRLREFVLTHGTDDGALPGYTADEIAVVMEPTCSTTLLFSSLRRFEHLQQRRKRWFVPGWKRTPMGRYCSIRKWDRERKQELREARHEAALEQMNGEEQKRTSSGRPTDVASHSSGNPAVSKKRRPADVPPIAPQRGAGGKHGAARWRWFKSVHPKISSPEKCIRLLKALTAEEWEHLQFSLPQQAASSRWLRNRGRFCPRADIYLQRKAFLELRRGTPANSKPKTVLKKRTPAQEKMDKKKLALDYLLEFLADPHRSAEKKAEAKEQWLEDWGEKPWEKGK
jgi:hypothetical protein